MFEADDANITTKPYSARIEWHPFGKRPSSRYRWARIMRSTFHFTNLFVQVARSHGFMDWNISRNMLCTSTCSGGVMQSLGVRQRIYFNIVQPSGLVDGRINYPAAAQASPPCQAGGVTAEYPALFETPLENGGYADTQWSSTTPPLEFVKCVGEWIRGYAVEFDHPSPRICEVCGWVDTRIRSGVRPPLPPNFWDQRSCSLAVTKSWKAEKLIWKNWLSKPPKTKLRETANNDSRSDQIGKILYCEHIQ